MVQKRCSISHAISLSSGRFAVLSLWRTSAAIEISTIRTALQPTIDLRAGHYIRRRVFRTKCPQPLSDGFSVTKQLQTLHHLLTFCSSLDRLIQLLDTGASPAIRQAAAKQIAQIATKCLRTDSGIEGDINTVKSDPAGPTTSQERLEDWSEVISVAAKVTVSFVICAPSHSNPPSGIAPSSFKEYRNTQCGRRHHLPHLLLGSTMVSSPSSHKL
jgi:hypothetical protein